MIRGHGIDLQAISAIAKAQDKHPRFAQRVLTPAELAVFQQKPRQAQLTYLAGRWAAKEAFSKALGTGIGKTVGFQDLEVLSDSKGAPYFSRLPYDGKAFVSISHSGDFVQASVILEEDV
ncbi:holo-ACP synthase [Streptococcus sp. DD12]|uniref:holo-ACP synthase n=1 Tax=Streptococcus sp. DD12 TaxID=1777880 RepID=UPI00079A468C|nr:holo-ACP synthase [Streptococcus sp. DD12]KXT75821.1 Holo-(acyl-carrier protein) synthase [Streptococcus sp. DD12]